MEIPVIDRSVQIARLNVALEIDPSRTAVITVDMHRGHLDPALATSPLPPESVGPLLQRTAALLDLARSRGMPVFHVNLARWPVETGRHPYKQVVHREGVSLLHGTGQDILHHNLVGSPGTELMPELGPAPGDYVIDRKKTYSAFLYTELDRMLRVLEINTVVLAGVNTNTCVLCTAFEAVNRLYRAVVIGDCVDSGYGPDLHAMGLEIIRSCFGWVLSLDEFSTKLGADASKAR